MRTRRWSNRSWSSASRRSVCGGPHLEVVGWAGLGNSTCDGDFFHLPRDSQTKCNPLSATVWFIAFRLVLFDLNSWIFICLNSCVFCFQKQWRSHIFVAAVSLYFMNMKGTGFTSTVRPEFPMFQHVKAPLSNPQNIRASGGYEGGG